MVLFGFLIDFYPFSFWIEFLVVIPSATLLSMLLAVAQSQKGSEQVCLVLAGVQAVVGYLLIGYVALRVIGGYEQLVHWQVVYSLGLPFVMSVLFVPLLFVTCAVFAYEDAFVAVSIRSSDSKRLLRWKKWRLVLRFGLNLKALQAFRRSSAIHEYGWVKSKGEASSCLKEYSQLEHPERFGT